MSSERSQTVSNRYTCRCKREISLPSPAWAGDRVNPSSPCWTIFPWNGSIHMSRKTKILDNFLQHCNLQDYNRTSDCIKMPRLVTAQNFSHPSPFFWLCTIPIFANPVVFFNVRWNVIRCDTILDTWLRMSYLLHDSTLPLYLTTIRKSFAKHEPFFY